MTRITWARPLHWQILLLALAIGAGLLLRGANLDRKVYWFDEVFTSINAAAQNEQADINPAIYTAQPLAPTDLQTFLRPKPGSTLLDVLRLLIRKDPVQGPVYFSLARLWMDLFGSAPATMRSLTALCGALTIPAFGLLCCELYRDRAVVGVGMALLALSPFFVRYSQEARPYMLLALLLVLAHAAFLRALRLRTPASFAIHGALVALALLTQSLVALAFCGHAIYLLCRREYRTRPLLGAYALTLLGAAIVCAPWFWATLRGFRTIMATHEHLTDAMPLQAVLLLTDRNISHLLFAWELAADNPLLWLVCVVLALLVYAFYRLWRDGLQRPGLFLLIQLVLPLLVLALPDAFLGGRVLATDRYFVPAYVAAALALAYLLARPRFWRVACATVLSASLVSSYIAVQSDDWWGLSQVDIDIMRIMNSDAPNLLVSQVNFGVVAPLGYGLQPANRIILSRADALPAIPPGFKHIYVYQPTAAFLQALVALPGVTLAEIYRQPRWEGTVYTLYELRRKGP